MAERNEIGGPLRGHDPGHLRRRKGIPLRELAQGGGRLRPHAQEGARRCPPALMGLSAHVDHVDRTRLIDVG
jgi:hypothetical protein